MVGAICKYAFETSKTPKLECCVTGIKVSREFKVKHHGVTVAEASRPPAPPPGRVALQGELTDAVSVHVARVFPFYS